MAHIFASIKESLSSVLPIALIVLILSVTCVTLEAGVLVLFLFGTILLILGMSFFTVGSAISMEPLGDGMSKKIMALFSIVEQGKGKKLIKALQTQKIRVNFQTIGNGTAPTEKAFKI